MRKSLFFTALLAILAAGVAWGTSAARTAPREIVLVARDMALYIEGDATPNPTLDAGTWDYLCRLHVQTMRGTLEVR